MRWRRAGSAVGEAERALLPPAQLPPPSGEAVATQSVSAQGMCTHTISMHTQDAPNLDAHLPFLHVACVPESYDDEKDPKLGIHILLQRINNLLILWGNHRRGGGWNVL